MIHSVDYSYAERKATVVAERCEVRIEFTDPLNGSVIYQASNRVEGRQSIWASPSRRWHCDFVIKVYADGALEHVERTSIKDRTVIVRLDSVAIGDTLAWFPQVLEFQRKYGCSLLVSSFHNYLLGRYETPRLKLIGPEEVPPHDVTYRIGVFEDQAMDPHHWKTKPLAKSAADILGVVYRERHLDLRHLAGKRPIAEKYAVIGPVSTMTCKEWQNSTGWQEVVAAIRRRGLQVICCPVPRYALSGLSDCPVSGDLVPGALTAIAHAEYFVGLASGLSWLAAAVGTPAVVISGFSEPFTEFKQGCTRIMPDRGVCHGCYNDTSIVFEKHREWCPRGRNFECTRSISGGDVAAVLPRMRPSRRKRILCVLPHCSTGGLPQYFLEKLKVLREHHDVFVIEWSFSGEAFNIQRRRIRELAAEFIEMCDHRREFQSVVDDIVPDAVHFEELPSTFDDNWILADFHGRKDRFIIHTSHCSHRRPIWLANRYVFPSAYQNQMYPELGASVLEYPIFDKSYDGPTCRIVLNVGIVSPHKNQAYLVELARCMPGEAFYFAGPLADNFRDYWHPLIKSAPANCVFLGQQDEAELDALYRKCRVLVHPSTTELCPLVFNEALSYGMPVLANWLPTYEALSFKDRLGGLLMHPEQDADMLRAVLAVAGRERVSPNYNEFSRKVMETYE